MALPSNTVEDPRCQLNWQKVAGLLFFGKGVPTFKPPGAAIYIRSDGGAGTTLYVFEAGSWAAK